MTSGVDPHRHPGRALVTHLELIEHRIPVAAGHAARIRPDHGIKPGPYPHRRRKIQGHERAPGVPDETVVAAMASSVSWPGRGCACAAVASRRRVPPTAAHVAVRISIPRGAREARQFADVGGVAQRRAGMARVDRRNRLREGLHDLAVELRAGTPPQLPERVRERAPRPIRPGAGHRVERVGHVDDLRQQRRLVAAEAVRVALAIRPLMVQLDNLQMRLEGPELDIADGNRRRRDAKDAARERDEGLSASPQRPLFGPVAPPPSRHGENPAPGV